MGIDDGWFRWVLGGLVGFYTMVTSWLTINLFNMGAANAAKHAELDRRVSMLEIRPQIDPIKYTEVITQLTGMIAALNSEVVNLRHQIAELEEVIVLLRDRDRGGLAR